MIKPNELHYLPKFAILFLDRVLLTKQERKLPFREVMWGVDPYVNYHLFFMKTKREGNKARRSDDVDWLGIAIDAFYNWIRASNKPNDVV